MKYKCDLVSRLPIPMSCYWNIWECMLMHEQKWCFFMFGLLGFVELEKSANHAQMTNYNSAVGRHKSCMISINLSWVCVHYCLINACNTNNRCPRAIYAIWCQVFWYFSEMKHSQVHWCVRSQIMGGGWFWIRNYSGSLPKQVWHTDNNYLTVRYPRTTFEDDHACRMCDCLLRILFCTEK